MKKILFMFLCLSFLNPLFAQSQDSETNTEEVKENDPKDSGRDISSETDKDTEKNELDEIERKTDQDYYEPENIPEEDENL